MTHLLTTLWVATRCTERVLCVCCLAHQQNEEIEVLKSIFEDDIQLNDDYDNPGSSRSFTVAIPGPHSILLTVHLPSTYPSEDAPIAIVSESFGLTNAVRDEITQDLASIFQRANGQVCLYEWIENVRDKYANSDYDPAQDLESLSLQDAQEPEPKRSSIYDAEVFRSDPQTLRPRVRGSQTVRDREREERLRPLIYHGTTIIDRKSTFQGHACPVTCVEDVRSFLAILLDDRKIERAIHNMLAYRITGEYTVKDNDEDGEDGAGSKMSHLLELTNAENVAVVVTRWFGGILLGPDRFKHINTAARQALEDGGFLQSSASSSKKKSKK
ncbi:hypothetical protein Poli38472_005840 [Pythium oligandrum]|uniref:RWD domain-containing protein n=1 Tax=Pythium oligandrum TaxID=41045 RepID=A0A8K1FQW3_PYTOL|nr:hypothetical protein Poli38472_005840 [Pythium oligandrum]|eukprot:TMW68372.1 hypothetical protein Poli38472_005840 [Pythium oligandrum]